MLVKLEQEGYGNTESNKTHTYGRQSVQVTFTYFYL